MAICIYIAHSLDGFIAGPEGELDWLQDIPNPDHSDFGFTAFLKKIDAIVMGRKTFETVQSFGVWPYKKPVYVISSTLNKLPEEYSGKAAILNLKPAQIITTLKKQGLHNLYIDGGTLIQSFLNEDLIDEMILTAVPVVLGDGLPLFGKLNTRLKFTLQKSETLNNFLVKSHYSRDKITVSRD